MSHRRERADARRRRATLCARAKSPARAWATPRKKRDAATVRGSGRVSLREGAGRRSTLRVQGATDERERSDDERDVDVTDVDPCVEGLHRDLRVQAREEVGTSECTAAASRLTRTSPRFACVWAQRVTTFALGPSSSRCGDRGAPMGSIAAARRVTSRLRQGSSRLHVSRSGTRREEQRLNDVKACPRPP